MDADFIVASAAIVERLAMELGQSYYNWHTQVNDTNYV
jgi:hypothetical protein